MRSAIFTKLNSTPAGNVLNVDREHTETVIPESMTATTTPPDIHDTLGLTPRGRRRRIGRWLIAALVIVALAAVVLRMRANAGTSGEPVQNRKRAEGCADRVRHRDRRAEARHAGEHRY